MTNESRNKITHRTIDAADLPALVRASWAEKQFQAEVKALAEENHWLVYHDYDSRRSAAGFPDLVLVHVRRRLAIFAELKVKDRPPTPAQQRWLAALMGAGLTAVLWTPGDWSVIVAVLTAPEGE